MNRIDSINVDFSYEGKDRIKKYVEFKNKITILYGKNASGKSTTIKLLLNLISSNETDIKYNSETKYNSYFDFVRDNVICYLDIINFELEYITVSDFLKLNKIELSELNNIEMGEFSKKFLIELSHGTRKKLAILRALKSNKQILILDEVTNGIDLNSKKYFAKEFNKTDKQIILATHDDQFISFLEGFTKNDY